MSKPSLFVNLVKHSKIKSKHWRCK